VAVCSVSGEDIAAWLVSQDWALAYVRYSHDYVDEEITARTAKRGIWRGKVMPPWAWKGRGADTCPRYEAEPTERPCRTKTWRGVVASALTCASLSLAVLTAFSR
jgi:hypothetical protein